LDGGEGDGGINGVGWDAYEIAEAGADYPLGIRFYGSRIRIGLVMILVFFRSVLLKLRGRKQAFRGLKS
jgi:hypothetical protein